LEEGGGLFGGEGAHLVSSERGSVDEVGDVAGDQPPSDCLPERSVQDGVQVVHAGGGEPFGELVGVEALEVPGGQLGQCDASQCRHGMPANVGLIRDPGLRAQR